jgi:hypothetical protein
MYAIRGMRRVLAPKGTPDILFGEAPYGWKLTRDRSKLVKDPDEQRVLAVVSHMYFMQRMPMRDIVARLDELGVVNRRSRPFGLSSVFEMIHRGKERPPEAAPRNGAKRGRARARTKRA